MIYFEKLGDFMALIKCPECNGTVSTEATTCPHCGYPLKNVEHEVRVTYENTTVRVSCWGLGGSNAIIEKLQPYLSKGWEIVSTVEDHWRGGAFRHVYTVVLKRARKEN